MFVWIVFAAMLGVYSFSVPVKFALVAHIYSRTRLCAGAAAFESRFALKSAYRRTRRDKKTARKLPKIKLQCVLPALFQSGKYLLKHTRLEKIQAQGSISAPDAAQTALICGGAHAVESALSPLLAPGTVQLQLRPDFSALHSDAQFCGIFSIRAGHIMIAALIGAWNYLSRRISNGKTSH